MAPTRPLSLKKCNGSELSNAVAISPFRNITWPTSVSIHDKTLKGGKIHRYNKILKNCIVYSIEFTMLVAAGRLFSL